WTLLNPLLIFASFTVIFATLNHWEIRDYGIYFFSGFLFWTMFSNSCIAAADSIVYNSTYVTKIYAPRAVFPLSMVAISLVDLGAGFVVLLLLGVIFGNISWTLIFIPISVAIAVTFVAGVALLCAAWNVLLRDFRHVL